jgi:hypothetical protein
MGAAKSDFDPLRTESSYRWGNLREDQIVEPSSRAKRDYRLLLLEQALNWFTQQL